MCLNQWKYAQCKSDVNPHERVHPTIWLLIHLQQGSSTFSGWGPINIFNITLRAAVITDYKLNIHILNINISLLSSSECSAKGRSFTANSDTKVAVLLGMNRCGSFPLLSTHHCLFNIWTVLKRSEKIPGAPAWRWGEWIWLTGPSRLHRNSLHQGFCPDQRSEIPNHPSPP